MPIITGLVEEGVVAVTTIREVVVSATKDDARTGGGGQVEARKGQGELAFGLLEGRAVAKRLELVVEGLAQAFVRPGATGEQAVAVLGLALAQLGVVVGEDAQQAVEEGFEDVAFGSSLGFRWSIRL